MVFHRYASSIGLFISLLIPFAAVTHASLGDRLPEFRECVSVSKLIEPLSINLPNTLVGVHYSKLRIRIHFSHP